MIFVRKGTPFCGRRVAPAASLLSYACSNLLGHFPFDSAFGEAIIIGFARRFIGEEEPNNGTLYENPGCIV
jgi:hypothetical protein